MLTFIFLVLLAIFVWAYNIKPKHTHIEFPHPPSFARINTPRREWDEKRRTVRLTNGSDYVIPRQAKGHFVLLHDWAIKCGVGNSIATYNIPANTPTDFASIPRLAHSLISPLSNSVYGAVLHDYLYRNPGDPTANATSKSQTDALFYWSLRSCGVGKLLSGLMYLAVHLFGKNSYKR